MSSNRPPTLSCMTVSCGNARIVTYSSALLHGYSHSLLPANLLSVHYQLKRLSTLYHSSVSMSNINSWSMGTDTSDRERNFRARIFHLSRQSSSWLAYPKLLGGFGRASTAPHPLERLMPVPYLFCSSQLRIYPVAPIKCSSLLIVLYVISLNMIFWFPYCNPLSSGVECDRYWPRGLGWNNERIRLNCKGRSVLFPVCRCWIILFCLPWSCAKDAVIYKPTEFSGLPVRL